MTLRQKQSLFVRMQARLILHAELLGYELTHGHSFRCDDCKVGKAESLHKKKLAQDWNLFKNGKYLRKTSDHEPLGIFWESIGGTWGGRFKKKDGNHYSLAYGKMK